MLRINFVRTAVLVVMLNLSAEAKAQETVPRRPAPPRTLTRVPVAGVRLPLMAFVDEKTQDRHGKLLAEWAVEVAKEGTFAVEWVRRPRVETWTSANRVEAVMGMLKKVQDRKPAAVMLWGAVGWVATGTYDPDGHGPRVAWTDLPFASDQTTWTDARHFKITYPVALGQNFPGDGRWDQVFDPEAGLRAKRSVGRVDFSNLKSTRAASNVDEDQAMEDYLRRNLAYRRGLGFSNEVVFVGSLVSPANRAWIRTNIVGRPVRDTGPIDFKKPYPVAGQRLFAMYTSVVPYLREGFRDTTGTMTSTLWTVLYKSFAGDPWNVAETQRQYLQQSLVVTFGGRHWLPNGATVHEAFLRHSYPGLAYLVAEDSLMGDVTLPLK
jgi:hypothetical protein